MTEAQGVELLEKLGQAKDISLATNAILCAILAALVAITFFAAFKAVRR